MRRFWKFITNKDSGQRTLHLEGTIAEDTWWGDEITPAMFREELGAGKDDLTVWINSPGGDVFAAAQIYNMLMEYKGKVTVKIDGIAASAASVIAMAGGEVQMSPVSCMMIHNPATIAIGDADEMLRAKSMLDEVKESIINAYAKKTGLPRKELSKYMNAESWFNAHKAVELGFADAVLYAADAEPSEKATGMVFSRQAVTASLLSKIKANKPAEDSAPLPAEDNTHIPIETLDKRLSLILH
jgi:ATP-dependent Clp protease protease subunit